MKKQLKNLSLLCIAILFGGTLYAQDLMVNLANGNTETFAVNDITSIKFNTTDMILYETDGTVNTWTIDDIDNYSFDLPSSISESSVLLKEDVSVYPNPSTDKVNIAFTSNVEQHINIEILDLNGKVIHSVYSGMHKDNNTYTWSPENDGQAEAGSYLCKITTENKVITKSIIIQ